LPVSFALGAMLCIFYLTSEVLKTLKQQGFCKIMDVMYGPSLDSQIEEGFLLHTPSFQATLKNNVLFFGRFKALPKL